MKITKEIQYAVRSLCDMAYHSEGYLAQVKSISQRQDISSRYLELIFDKLRKGGVVKSLRGSAGGYFLSRKPEQISIGDVIRTIEGKDLQLTGNHSGKRGSGRPCARSGERAVSDIWDGASKILMNYFDSVTLDRICEDAREKGTGI